MLVDTHAHLFKQKFDDQQIDQIVKDLSKNNIEKVILASAEIEDCEGNLLLTHIFIVRLVCILNIVNRLHNKI